MSYSDRTTGFNMDEEFGSHIDENGFISFTKQKPQKKFTKDDHIYGVWNQEVEDNVFQGQRQLAKTTLAMNFRKSGQIQHDPDTGIRVKYASGKQETSAKKDEQKSTQSSNLRSKLGTQKKDKQQKKSVRFDESNLQEIEIRNEKKKKASQFGFDEDIDPLSYVDDDEEENKDGSDDEENDQLKQKMNQKSKYMQMFQRGMKDDDEDEELEEINQDEEGSEDEEDEGFSTGRKNKLFFKTKKSDKNKKKSILKQKQQMRSINKNMNDDLDDLNDLDSGDENQEQQDDEDENAYEDQDEKFNFSKGTQSSQILLTKEQMRKKKIYNFKRNREDDEEAIIEEQTQQFNLPLKFGQQRKQFKKKSEAEIEEESNSVINLETKFESNQAKIDAEKYGKGFSMLQRMGFKVGKGIGKEEQGRLKPIEANFKQSFTMYDDYKKMEQDNKKILKELGIDVEAELDNFDRVVDDFKKNQSEFGDYDDDHTIELEKTYVKRNEENKRFPNRFFAHLNKKSRQAKTGSSTDIGATYDQVIKSDSSLQSTSNIGSSTNMKIIDMRGDSTVTYDSSKGSGYSDFFAANKILDAKSLSKQESPIFSEMLYNLKNKLDKIKSKKMNLSSKLKIEMDRIVQVQYEEQQLIEKSNNHKKVIDQTVIILDKLQAIRQNENELGGADILKAFTDMFDTCNQQFTHFNLEQLLVSQITSCLNRKFEKQIQDENKKSKISNSVDREEEMDLDENFSEEEIQESSSRNKRAISSESNFMKELNKLDIKMSVQLIQQVEKLLTKIFLFKQNQNLVRYESELSGNIQLKKDTIINEKNDRIIQRYVQYIINHSFMPHLKNYMIKVFNPTNLKSNNEIIDCLEEYQKILPKPVISDLVQSFILPKLNDAVKKWNPVKNEQRNLQNDVDLWLIPWITIISPIDLLKDTFKLVLSKYSQVLSKWEIQDKSMYEKLKPWKTIISEQQWNDLMLKQIIPKLQFYLDSIEINPSDQKDLDVIEIIVKWCDLLSEKDICNIMEDTLLVKLAEVLMEWLSTEEVEKQEIKSWLSSWESLLGKKIMNIESFSQTFAQFFSKIDEL